MVKDLMPLLRANPRWNQEQENVGHNDILHHENRHAAIEMQTLQNNNMDPFLKRLEAVIDDIDQIASNNKNIETLQKSIWIGVNQIQVEQDKVTLNNTSNESKSIGIKIRDFLRKEQDEIDKREKELLNLEGIQSKAKELHETRLKGTQVAAQSRRFYQEWTKFNNLQVQFRDKIRENMRKQCKIIKADVTENEIETMLDEGNFQGFNFSILVSNERATKQIKEQITELNKRRDQFLNLEKAIEEIRDLFFEMADLVSHQGEMINNIERNVELSVVHVEKGTHQLEVAVIYQRKARKKQIICGVIVIIAIFILVIAVVGFPSSSPDEDDEDNDRELGNPDSKTEPQIITDSPTEPSIQTSFAPPLDPSIEPPIY